ncbi:hypothetical protein Q2T83_00585 [Fervidibacter sacchari]|uniref:Type I-B CRISPR-associated protein Cas8b1/Cst1 n=1 Tax=Candidatus Fervidibacter sacchari TaxID=1448929 RepID=A0ABT2ERT1_9BACT|nr:hypothetical protein [Candidatus Fervidibacter sacchari]MCS3920678.1 hypothetical protein [Candidatus Fervidibacter sacchari]WKU16348.1 hypothetical protein Q2T83_00585 [Candidatus Fervidibacter sacchari]
MTLKAIWRMRNDPWIDNGLELFGHIVEEIQKQHPRVVQVRWEPEALEITVQNMQRFVELLDDALRQRIAITVFYMAERKGEKRPDLKPFVGFNQQPPAQHPPTYQEAKRREFLQEVFSFPASQGRGEPKSCLLCGERINSDSKKLTLSVYPFVTKIRALSGARSKWSGEGLSGFTPHPIVCPFCYLLGSLVWADDALLYLCDIGGTDGNAVILLPAPLASNLMRLREVKASYRPRYGERRTNVRFKRKPRREGQPEEEREVQDGPYSLLLAFLERVMDEIAERDEVTDLFTEVQRRVSEGWLILSIPQGRLKNITAHNLILDEPTLRLLAKLVEQGNLPYAHCISEIWVTDEKGKRLQDIVPDLHEQMAKAILTDNFDLFAQTFVPKPRRQLRFPFAIESIVENLITLWRWSNMDAQTLEIVKKAGRALARIAASKKQPVLLYALERVRSSSDLLEVLKEGVHRLIGLEAEEMRYISLDALEQLTELLHQITDARQFADLKNTLIIFAGIAYAKDTMTESRQTLTGGEA